MKAASLRSEVSSSWKSTLLAWLTRGTSALFLLGVILRLTVRDHLPYLAALFYGLPLPILVGLAGGTVLLLWRQDRLQLARFWTFLFFAALFWCVVATTWWHSPRATAREPIRILCWNTCRGRLGWQHVADFINQQQPDIAGLVEAGEWSEERRTFWQQSCPGYHVSLLGGGVVCLTRRPAQGGIAVRLPVQGEYRRLDVFPRGQRITLFIVDMKSNPLTSRQECLQQLARDANDLKDLPVVVLGDFNTPADSVHFKPLRSEHRHAFEMAGQGYLATWPVPFPVLCLDHIWSNRRVEFQSCRHGWSAASDHRPVIAEVRIVP